jgi:hypothetical protein
MPELQRIVPGQDAAPDHGGGSVGYADFLVLLPWVIFAIGLAVLIRLTWRRDGRRGGFSRRFRRK